MKGRSTWPKVSRCIETERKRACILCTNMEPQKDHMSSICIAGISYEKKLLACFMPRGMHNAYMCIYIGDSSVSHLTFLHSGTIFTS